MRPRWRIGLVVALALAATNASAADRIRVAVQRTGTLAWELDVIKARGFDKQADLAIEPIELTSTEAGKDAIKSGSADLMLSDWLWVARERALGDQLVFYRSSSTLGAVMVPASSPIKGIADLKGRRLAVAGGPLDKSWLLLQALARRSGVDLRKEANVVYGAAPLLSQKALQGEADATLTFWNFCTGLEGNGQRRAIEIADVLKELGAKMPLAVVGFTFDAGWASKNKIALEKFLHVIQQAKDLLATSDDEWWRLAPRIGARQASALAIYRQRYRDGVFRRPIAEEEANAAALYRMLAEIGGVDLVGPAKELPPGTFYRPGGTP